jgi:hypothetical protein
MKKHYLAHLAAIGFYTLLTLFFTWPLAQHLPTHIPGEATWAFDESTFIWNMWWLKFSLLNLQQTPLESTHTFFPLGIDLTTYTFNLFHAAFGLPLQLTLSLPLANNLTLFFSYISSAYGTFLLALHLLHQSDSKSKIQNLKYKVVYLSALAAGAVFAFSASRMMYVALGHYNFVTVQWFPFYTLFLLKTLRTGTLKNIFITSLFAALCLYAELTYSVFLLFITLIILTAELINRRHQEHPSPITHHPSPGLAQSFNRLHPQSPIPNPQSPTPNSQSLTPNLQSPLFSLLLIGLLTFILAAPFVLSVLPDFLNPAFNEPGWGEGLKLSADLVGLVTLNPLHPLSGLDWITELRAVIEGTSRFSDANTLFLGYGILALALLGFITHRRITRMWLWAVLFFTLLSLGPLLTINGQNRFNLDGIEVTFPLPFALLHFVPLLSANRVPNRFGIPLTLALAVLAGYGLAWLLTQINKSLHLEASPTTHHVLRTTFYILLVTLLLFDQYSVPLPLTDARIPAVYHQIGAEPDNFTIMQLPLGWRNSYGTLGAERTQLQYYQAAHRRPMLGGNTSRNPRFKFDYYANVPLFAALTEAELYRNIDDGTLEQARHQAAELMSLYNIKYLVIHDPIPFRKPYEDTFLSTRRLALDLIPHQSSPVYRSPGVEVFAVEQADIPNPLVIDFGTPAGNPYRGEGWAANEEVFAATANWAIERQAEIFFPVRGEGDRHLAIEISPFSYPSRQMLQVSLGLNGQLLDHNSQSLHEGWQTVETRLPEELLASGLNRLTLAFDKTAQPREVLPANRLIGGTGLATPVDLEVNSGADFAFITVDFAAAAVDASAHRRGVNVAVVHPRSGEVVTFKGFDTAANEFEANALNQFIAEIPTGHIVIIATQGLEAITFFNDNTAIALQSLGLSAETLTPPFSAIGVKGASGATALQATGEGTAYLRLGANPDTRNLAAAVDKVIITRP